MGKNPLLRITAIMERMAGDVEKREVSTGGNGREAEAERVIPGSGIIGTRGPNAVALLDTYRVSNVMNCAAQSQRTTLNPHGIGRKLPPVPES